MQMTTSRYASLALAIAVGTTLGACSGRRSPAVPESAGGSVAAPPPGGAATGATTGAATGATTGATTGAATGADTTRGAAGGEVSGSLKGLSDANYAALVDEANKADSAAGAMAVTKATNPRVKAFARRMMTDHHALRQQDQRLVKQLNLTPQPPANDPVQQLGSQETSALQSAQKGAAFDSAYIAQEVNAHKAVLSLLDAIDSDASNAQLKALAKKARPMIQSHLTEAQSIQKHLQSGTKSDTSD